MLPAIRSCICSRRYADDAGGCETGGGDAFWEGGLISFSGPGVRAVGGGLARNIASKSALGVGVGWGVEGGVAVGGFAAVGWGGGGGGALGTGGGTGRGHGLGFSAFFSRQGWAF